MAERNPLHRQALTLDEVRPGVEFIWYNIETHQIKRGTVQGWPDTEGYSRVLVAIRLPEFIEAEVPLDDMGIVPYPDPLGWSTRCFTIAIRWAHTLPPEPQPPTRGISMHLKPVRPYAS